MLRYRMRCLILLCCMALAWLPGPASVARSPGGVAGDAPLPPAAPAPTPQTLPAKEPSKMEWVLHELSQLGRAGQWSRATEFAQQRGVTLDERRVQVVLEGTGASSALESAALSMGLTVEASYGNWLRVLAPVASLPDIAGLSAVRRVRLPYRPHAMAVVSQGVALSGANAWHAAGYTGGGVKVAVIDLGFQNYTYRMAAGELPADLVTRSFRSDGDIQAGDPHGTACAEIVYDMAPGVKLYLINISDEFGLAQAVDYALAQGVQVISCSLGWLDAGPFDGSGPLCDSVNKARQGGIFWAQSAGNGGDRHWEGPWSDPHNLGRLEFDVADQTQSLTAAANEVIEAYLIWDDPWGAAGNDYDLYLLNKDLWEVASSENLQDGDDYPVEHIRYPVGPNGAGTYHLVIQKYNAGGTSHFELYSLNHTPEHRVPESSLFLPADAAGAVTVGAIHWQTLTLEAFSSQGPTNDGRFKPELVAPDRVSTVSYPGGFLGTSAGTPHLAGAAALVRGAYPTYNVSALVTFLTRRAVDLGPVGPDHGYGYGRLSLGADPSQATPTPTPTATRTITPTPVRSPTPTRTLVPGTGGAIAGNITLEGREQHTGATVNAEGRLTTTGAGGAFWLAPVPPGFYDVAATMPGYLRMELADVEVVPGLVTTLPPAALAGGDANNDCVVDLFDVVVVATNYDSSPPADPRADINGDNWANLFDLVLVCKHLDWTCPRPWELPPASAAQAGTLAGLRVSPPLATVKKGEWITVTVALDGVTGLYGADIRLSFDPALLQAVDADLSQPDLQVRHGALLDPRQAVVIRDTADNETGTVHVALSLRRPALPVSGGGTLFSITFRATGCGSSPLDVVGATLASEEARPIPLSVTGGRVSVLPGALYLPVLVSGS